MLIDTKQHSMIRFIYPEGLATSMQVIFNIFIAYRHLATYAHM